MRSALIMSSCFSYLAQGAAVLFCAQVKQELNLWSKRRLVHLSLAEVGVLERGVHEFAHEKEKDEKKRQQAREKDESRNPCKREVNPEGVEIN